MKNCLQRTGTKAIAVSRISRKIVSRELNARSYRDLPLGRHVCKIREIGGQKNGVQHATEIYPIPRYTRPRYIGLTMYSTAVTNIEHKAETPEHPKDSYSSNLVWGPMLHNLQPVDYHVSLLSTVAFQKENLVCN